MQHMSVFKWKCKDLYTTQSIFLWLKLWLVSGESAHLGVHLLSIYRSYSAVNCLWCDVDIPSLATFSWLTWNNRCILHNLLFHCMTLHLTVILFTYCTFTKVGRVKWNSTELTVAQGKGQVCCSVAAMKSHNISPLVLNKSEQKSTYVPLCCDFV